MKKTILLCTLLASGICALPVFSYAALLTQASFTIPSSGGAGGSGSNPYSGMIFSTYGTDGWGWFGGAGGVQGSAATTVGGGTAIAANEAFKWTVGSTVDTLNAAYGKGNWTIDNAKLSFNSSYNVQNNSRFGLGSGTFDIYWVGNDNWATMKGTETDRGTNPVFAASGTDLLTWSGSQALLDASSFTCSGTGSVALSYNLEANQLFVNDILSASSANPFVSLYLMATSDTLGMVIFTGGQGQALPTLSFDVVDAAPVPIPAAAWLLGSGLLGLVGVRRRKAA